MSATQSPPIATATARPITIVAGSWITRGVRHRASAIDNALVRPVFSAIRNYAVDPACDTTPVPEPSADNDGYGGLDLLTRLVLVDHEIFEPSQVELSQVGTFLRFTTRNQRDSARLEGTIAALE